MVILAIELVLIAIMGIALINVLKDVPNEYAEGSAYQIVVNCFAVTREFASTAEARAFAHAIAKAKAEEDEQVRLFKVFALEARNVNPVGLKAAYEAGKKEYAKGYNKATLAKKWW